MFWHRATKNTIDTTVRDLGDFFLELLKVVVLSLAIILPIRYYVVQPFYVKGASMEPTFLDNEYLLIDEITYQFSSPSRGQVVVFRYPRDPSQFFIKRVVGLPGETVHIEDGTVSVTNKTGQTEALAESYLAAFQVTTGTYDITVPESHYFLLGDNRTASLDSRFFGPVSEKYIIGRVWLRAWPFSRWTLFPNSIAISTMRNLQL
ncbi:MAG: signal peptidase I [Patescibacteria group bacterium]|jgi:signal peptidase I